MSEDAARQDEEWDALVAFYGPEMVEKNGNSWTIQITPDFSLLLNDIPADYPSCRPPLPRLVAPQWIMDEQRLKDLEKELLELHENDVEVAILWAEHVRAELEDYTNQNQQNNESSDHNEPTPPQPPETEPSSTSATTRTYIPPTSKYGQPMRTFETAVVDDPANKRTLFRGEPFHPPKSGPSEIMLAHVASVSSMDHVNWILHHLLFYDKKIGQATHNMFAFKFQDDEMGCIVSDSDDDGEKGSGSKLAALLDMTDAQNCIVVVSRWFGGVHLGPARFKWIAAVARQALDDAGFLHGDSGKGNKSGKKK